MLKFLQMGTTLFQESSQILLRHVIAIRQSFLCRHIIFLRKASDICSINDHIIPHLQYFFVKRLSHISNKRSIIDDTFYTIHVKPPANSFVGGFTI